MWPGIIDGRAQYLAAARRLRNTVLYYPCGNLKHRRSKWVKQAFICNILLEVKQKSLHTVWGHNACEAYEKESCYIVEHLCHSVVSLATGPQPLPKQVLHSACCSASSFNLQYPDFSLRSSSTF